MDTFKIISDTNFTFKKILSFISYFGKFPSLLSKEGICSGLKCKLKQSSFTQMIYRQELY